MNIFYKENEFGINIECTEIARCTENGVTYRIYTNFFSDNNPFGIKLLIDRYENEKYYDDVDEIKKQELINNFYQEISEISEVIKGK